MDEAIPHHFFTPHGVPVFTPTMAQMGDFSRFIKAIEPLAGGVGLAKVIPPPEWTALHSAHLAGGTNAHLAAALQKTRIAQAIEQRFERGLLPSGAFRVRNVETRRVYSVQDWADLALTKDKCAPEEMNGRIAKQSASVIPASVSVPVSVPAPVKHEVPLIPPPKTTDPLIPVAPSSRESSAPLQTDRASPNHNHLVSPASLPHLSPHSCVTEPDLNRLHSYSEDTAPRGAHSNEMVGPKQRIFPFLIPYSNTTLMSAISTLSEHGPSCQKALHDSNVEDLRHHQPILRGDAATPPSAGPSQHPQPDAQQQNSDPLDSTSVRQDVVMEDTHTGNQGFDPIFLLRH
ncbi:hypothetical protein HDU98_003411 [Podochytrium sp. JEL0797]|nr:hypothetical protein HDU98_003411 [Podochytrium sp. JEL0797]